jgi:hypothetical protein
MWSKSTEKITRLTLFLRTADTHNVTETISEPAECIKHIILYIVYVTGAICCCFELCKMERVMWSASHTAHTNPGRSWPRCETTSYPLHNII